MACFHMNVIDSDHYSTVFRIVLENLVRQLSREYILSMISNQRNICLLAGSPKAAAKNCDESINRIIKGNGGNSNQTWTYSRPYKLIK